MAAPVDGVDPASAFASAPAELDRMRAGIAAFVRTQVRDSGTDGVVVVVDGDVNSAVATMLAVEALGADRLFGLLLPSYKGTEAETFTAELLANGLGIDFERVQLLPFVHRFSELSVPSLDPPDGVRAMTNALTVFRPNRSAMASIGNSARTHTRFRPTTGAPMLTRSRIVSRWT